MNVSKASDDKRTLAAEDRGENSANSDLSVPTAWVQIEASGGNHNEYAWEHGRNSLRLKNVAQYGNQSAADTGHVLDTTLDGAPLELWLVRSNPLPPGVLVEVKVIGVAKAGADNHKSAPIRPVLLGVPLVDAAFATVFEPTHLPGETWRALCDLLGSGAGWGSSDEAAQLLHESRKAERVARAGKKQSTLFDPGKPLWKPTLEQTQDAQGAQNAQENALSNLSGLAPASETVRFSSAEYAFHKIPLSFQGDLAHCLLPDERIIFFAYRPRFSAQRNLLRRARQNEGLLMVTDRQVLWLVDAFPPDATMVHWGYNAQAFTVERLVSASLEKQARYTDLVLTAGSASGTETVRIAFPGTEGLDAPWEALEHIQRFIPRPGSRALRRIVEPRAPDRSAHLLKDGAGLSFLSSNVRAALHGRREALLEPGEPVLGEAFAAAIPYLKLPGRLVTVTPKRLIECGLEEEPQIFAIAKISTIRMQYSLYGSLLAVSIPAQRGVTTYRIHFNSPQQPWLGPLFVLLGQCMSAPYTQGAAMMD